MVYRDISDEQNFNDPLFKNEPAKYKASLMDRFFSFLIDYLLFSPFVSFILFLLFQDAIRYWRLNPSAPEQLGISVMLALSYVALFSAFQAGFIAIWRATPGQYFLKIQIQFEGEDSLIFFRAFCRQVGFWATILFAGIPWLALLSHPLQKTFYDRIADCRIYSKKQTSEFFGFEVENRYWQSFSATLMIFVGMLFVSFIMLQYRDITNRADSFKQAEKKNQFCTQLKGVGQASRLQLAIAMNLVGQLSDECLDREADFVLWKNKTDEAPLAYFAKSLTEEESAMESKYLRQVCTPDSEDQIACRLVTAFKTADFESLYDYVKTKDTVLTAALTYELGMILKKDQDRESNFAALSQFDASRIVKKYLLSELITNVNNEGDRRPAALDDETERQQQALELIQDL